MSVRDTLRSHRGAAPLLAGLFFIILFGFLFWGYPFDGMILSDSWFLYVTDGGEFKWLTREQLLNRDPVVHPKELSSFTPSWSMLYSRRGLMPIAVWLIDRVSIGNRQVSVNLLCIFVQVVNTGLFAYVIWKIAGPRLFLPIFICAVLYPFSAGSHFWQYLIINNLAPTFFLGSLAAFLHIDHSAPKITGETIAWAVVSLICFWVSLLLVDYAIFMGPLYLYLALYYSNGQQSLFRFRRLLTPSSCVGLAMLLANLLAVIVLARGAPTFLLYAPRFEEIASYTSLPAQAITVLAVLANATLFCIASLFSNTIGYLLYPLSTVKAHYGVLLESPWILLGIGIIAGIGAFGLYRIANGQVSLIGSKEEGLTTRFVLMVGLLWAVLAYLPFMTAVGYPRVVGLTADRANILALWGVSICIGLFFHKLLVTSTRNSVARLASLYGGAFVALAVLVGSLYIQKESYVETYQKERQLAHLILENRALRAGDARLPIILLDRKEKITFPRMQIMGAMQDAGALSRIFGLLKFLADRYFIQEYVTSSFHLDGIMMFGCCPNSASVTFDGYAKWLKQERVPVYKHELPFYMEQNDGVYKIGYKDTEIWSKSLGSFHSEIYPTPEYQILRLKIADSFFHLRGALAYDVSAYAGNQAD